MTPPVTDGQCDVRVGAIATLGHLRRANTYVILFRLESYFNVFTMYFIMSSSIIASRHPRPPSEIS